MKKADYKYFYITVGLFIVGLFIGFVFADNYMNPKRSIETENGNQSVKTENITSNNPSNVTTNKTQESQITTQQAPFDGKISIDDDAIFGNKEAKVTIVEFSDYECPVCKKAYDTVFKELENEYIKTGKIRYVFRDYPLEQHPNSVLAASAAECAGEQNLYQEMHQKLFEEQPNWIAKNNTLDLFKGYAKELKLSESTFNTCIEQRQMESEIGHDIFEGEIYGVEVTPTYFINDKQLKGIQKYSALKKAIDADIASIK